MKTLAPLLAIMLLSKLSKLAAVVPGTSRASPVCRRPLFVPSPLSGRPPQCAAAVHSMRRNVAFSAGPGADEGPAREKEGAESGIREIKEIVDRAVAEEPVVEWCDVPIARLTAVREFCSSFLCTSYRMYATCRCVTKPAGSSCAL